MAVVRVKRRLSVEPAEALLIACKRIRTAVNDESELEDVQNVFTFAGTINSKDLTSSCVADVIQQQEVKPKDPKVHVVDITRRSRKAHHDASLQNRFKLVNRHRALVTTNDVENEKENSSTKLGQKWAIFDVEDVNEEEENVKKSSILQDCQPSDITCNGVMMVRQEVPMEAGPKNTQYVYDLYYMPDFNEEGLIYEHSFSIEKYMEPNYADFRERNVDYFASDDDDSNDENYYKNDYPEEDSDFETGGGVWREYGEDDINDWLSTCNLGNSELSDDEEYVHSETRDLASEIYDPGENFYRFKAKLEKQLQNTVEQDDIEEELPDESLNPLCSSLK